MALFKRKHIEKILQGEKTQTRRTHKHEWHVGRVYGLRDRWFQKAENDILITRKFREKLGDISLQDVKKEGYHSLEDFQKAWIEINGVWDPYEVVTAYEFKLLGAARRGKPSSVIENRKS